MALSLATKRLTEAAAAVQKCSKPIDKYLYLRDLGQKDPEVYGNLLFQQTQEILPFIYTPTVGEACELYHVLPIATRGLYIRLTDKGNVLEKLKSVSKEEVRVVVVTDGERILGLGDLGANGMGIAEGKITLYTVAAGVDPAYCMPMALDVGTNNSKLLDDPLYKGLRQKRPSREEYDEFIAEYVSALQQWQPHLLLQWEDFGTRNAFRILEQYALKICSFNDDIQGTACITLAAILSALRVQTMDETDQGVDGDNVGIPTDWKVMFFGAGEAGMGIGELIAAYCSTHLGQRLEEAKRRCFFVDSKGLVCKSRQDLQEHKKKFAHDVPFQPNLKAAVKELKPQVLIGVSTVKGSFDQEVVELMCEWNKRPIIMPLSNPTPRSECTFEEAFEWSHGRVLFASGTAFDPITTPDGTVHIPAQANNAYVFPGIGHASILTQCRSITTEVFVKAADVLCHLTTVKEASAGQLFPAFHDILDVSGKLMAAVCPYMIELGLGIEPRDKGPEISWVEYCKRKMWLPKPVAAGE